MHVSHSDANLLYLQDDEGHTALHWAMNECHVHAMEWLLQRGMCHI